MTLDRHGSSSSEGKHPVVREDGPPRQSIDCASVGIEIRVLNILQVPPFSVCRINKSESAGQRTRWRPRSCAIRKQIPANIQKEP